MRSSTTWLCFLCFFHLPTVLSAQQQPERSPAQQAGEAVRLVLPQQSISKFDRVDFSIDVQTVYERPFDPQCVKLDMVIKLPGGQEVRVPAFWMQRYERRELQARSGRASLWLYPDGVPGWQARYAPPMEGQYSAVVELTDSRGTWRSNRVQFACTASDNRGYIRVSSRDPRYFEFTDGTPFFPMGQNLAFIGEGQRVRPAAVPELFERLSQNGANYLRIWTCCHDWAMAIEARKSAWGRSWSWKPPFGTRGSEESSRQFVQLDSSGRKSIDVAPSHRVALRPETDYVLSGRTYVEPAARLQIEVAGRQLPQPLGGADRWQQFELPFRTQAGELWFGTTRLTLRGDGAAWIDALSLREAPGGPELLWEAAVNRPERGFYNPIDCAWLDEIVELARGDGIYLQLCLLTRDLYMRDLKDDSSQEYDRAIADARNLLRYAVARWGYSTSVAIWEYFNEMDPGLPLERFYREAGEYLDEVDIYRHLRSTSTWAPSARDCRSPALDVADVHFYLRPTPDRRYANEVEAAVGNARWLRKQAPAKPALIDEFGLANVRWGQTDVMRASQDISDFHNSLWASALSGASGTALAWWWERLDERGHYEHYRPLADFVADIPWSTADLQPTAASVSRSGVQLVGLQSDQRAYFWLFDPRASFESVVQRQREAAKVSDLQIDVPRLKKGTYRIEWWDTRAGSIVQRLEQVLTTPTLQVTAPAWQRDIACKIVRQP